MSTLPTLIVVSGPPGSGKTTLAHEIARAVGCPAICRDEIKEGMIHARPDVAPSANHTLNIPTNQAFFAALELLLGSGVTTVAEAAFQDRLWRPGLEPLLGLAALRIVHCSVSPEVARERIIKRAGENTLRQKAHDNTSFLAAVEGRVRTDFDAVRLPVPEIHVDTTTGYSPAIPEIVDFVNSREDATT